MHLTLLGTGCPSVHPERYGPSNLIHNNNTKILIDCGSGVTQRLVQSGFNGAEIDYLLLELVIIATFIKTTCFFLK